MQIPKQHILIAIAVLCTLFFGVVFFERGSDTTKTNNAATIAVGVASFEELSERFRDIAKDEGAVHAYDVLRKAPLPPQTDLHLLGHVVGDELYLQKGFDGIHDCTPEFRNACSHSIVVGALTEFGEGALDDIRKACEQAPGGPGAYTMCFHGLGHGVTAGLAYNLPETIEFCKKTGTKDFNEREYVECVGGAVMELMGGGGHDREKWIAARERYLTEPLSPCTNELMPDSLKEICLIYITPQIWEGVGIELGQPNPKKFKEAFAVCDSLPKSEPGLRNACFGGFGKEFVPLVGSRDIRSLNTYTTDQYTTVHEWCAYAQAPDGEDACVAEAVDSFFWGGENDPQIAFDFCGVLTHSDSTQGVCYESLAGNINQYIHGSQKKDLCKKLPEKHQEVCL